MSDLRVQQVGCAVGGLVGGAAGSLLLSPGAGTAFGAVGGCAAGAAAFQGMFGSSDKPDPKIVAAAQKYKDLEEKPFESEHRSSAFMKPTEVAIQR